MTRSIFTSAAALAFAGCLALPDAARAADGTPAGLAQAVEAVAPGADPVPGGFRFRVQGVAVSVLADEGSGLLRVVARAGELTEREVTLVASALGPDMIPDLAARVVSVRGLMCSAVLAPLRGVTDAVLRRAVDGAVQAAREAAHAPDPATPFGAVQAAGPLATSGAASGAGAGAGLPDPAAPPEAAPR